MVRPDRPAVVVSAPPAVVVSAPPAVVVSAPPAVSVTRTEPSDGVALRAPTARYFTDPAMTPCTKCRWKAKNTTTGTISDRNAPGASTSMLLPN